MALAQQVAANQQPPVLSSPALLPRTSTAKLLLLVHPAPTLLGGGRGVRLLHGAGARRAAAAVVRASSAQAEPKSEDREAVRAQVLRGPRRGHLRRGHPARRRRRRDRPVHRRRQGARNQLVNKRNEIIDVPSADLNEDDRSAVFGEDIWPAAGYGQTMYSIRQRVGPLYLKMERRFGRVQDDGELTEKEIIRAERNSGVASGRVREIQLQNYTRKMEQKMLREEDPRMGLRLYKDGKYEEALEKFESVLGSKPEPREASIASYNAACCYSKLDRLQGALSALEDALKAGYEDFKRIRTDPDLANLRKTEEFDRLLKNYDESFINENAINAIKSLFGLGKK